MREGRGGGKQHHDPVHNGALASAYRFSIPAPALRFPALSYSTNRGYHGSYTSAPNASPSCVIVPSEGDEEAGAFLWFRSYARYWVMSRLGEEGAGEVWRVRRGHYPQNGPG